MQPLTIDLSEATGRNLPAATGTPRAFTRLVLLEELRRRPGLPEVVSIEDEEEIGCQRLRPIQFRRIRERAGIGHQLRIAMAREPFVVVVSGSAAATR